MVTLETQVNEIADFLFFEDLWDVILVAHSSAGMLVPGVANLVAERIARIVYLDGYIVPAGGRGIDLWTPERREQALTSIASGNLFRDPFSVDQLGISDVATAAHVAKRLTPHPIQTFTEVVPGESPDAQRISKAYIHCTRGPLQPLFKPIADAVEARGWTVATLPAGHDAMLTHPLLLVEMLT
jgi:pimeloyl-ACP methyl ester carboxylesterase